MAYGVIFEREADPDGLEDWLNDIKAGLNRAEVIKKMVESEEFKTRLSGEANSVSILDEKLPPA